jgi:hypothetical protein
MLLVSIHGGAGLENLLAYSDDGKALPGPVLDFGNTPPTTCEFRGMRLAPDGALWVLNGSKDESAILRFVGSRPPYKLAGRLAVYTNPPDSPFTPKINSLWHPFELVLVPSAGGALCFVSNQDTDVVARLKADLTSQHVVPVPPPQTLPPGKYLEGTFVACSRKKLPDVPETEPVPCSEGGLDVKIEVVKGKEKVMHSVRGLALTNEVLYVADEPARAIKVYDLLGRFSGHESPVGGEEPVHLLAATDPSSGNPVLYVTAHTGVFWSPLQKGKPDALNFQRCISAKVASGIVLGADPRTLYVGERGNCRIKQYTNFIPKPGNPSATREWDVKSAKGVEQEVEFLLYVPG